MEKPPAFTPDLATPEGRARAFNARIDELILPEAQGGKGMAYNAAVAKLKSEPAGAKLVAAMGEKTSQAAEAAPDLSTPEGRSQAFNKRLNELTLPKAQGGEGLTWDDAVEAMKRNPEDLKLLEAMGCPVPGGADRLKK